MLPILFSCCLFKKAMLSLKLLEISLNGLFVWKNYRLEYFQKVKTLIPFHLKWNLLRYIRTDGGNNLCRTEISSGGNFYKAADM